MNGYMRALFTVPNALVKLSLLKLFHIKGISFGRVPRISRGTEITIDQGSKLILGNRFNMRGGSRIRVRKGAVLTIGNDVSLSHNCTLVCHERIEIGSDVQIAPGVLIYDHDHDFRVEGGIKTGKYKTKPVVIGDNVWIGANSIILRGTIIGDNCVIGAGSIVKGKVEEGSLYLQKREETVLKIT